MQAAYNDAWDSVEHHVLVIAAKEDGNHHVQTALELAGRHVLDGKYTVHVCIYIFGFLAMYVFTLFRETVYFSTLLFMLFTTRC